MLRKIISIKNIGRFKNFTAHGNQTLARYTLIAGANGSGKTTICAVLRSLKSGESSHISGRKTLAAVNKKPTVELLFSDGKKSFDGMAWSSSFPQLAIFDSIFVAENVHVGEVVEIDNRRNLYRIIIGEHGAILAKREAMLARQSREKANEVTAAAKAIQPYFPTDMKLDAFLALPADPKIDVGIVEQEHTVKAIHQTQQIRDRHPLSEIHIPCLPEEFVALLARTIDDIAQDAEKRVANHLAAHSMDVNGGNWIAEGLEHTDDDLCPFCGQNIEGLSLVAAYRAVFSDRYKAMRDEITAMRDQIVQQFGDVAIGDLLIQTEQNKGSIEFWSQYCNFNPASLIVPDDIPNAVRQLGQAAVDLLNCKDRTPLESIQPNDAFNTAAIIHADAHKKALQITEAIRTVNALIAAKKDQTDAADLQAAEAELARRQAIKIRHTDPVADLCAAHSQLTKEKEKIERDKKEVRTQLNIHTEKVIKPYEQCINRYLDAFNADFRIAETKHRYHGGTAASTYLLEIDDTAIDLGDRRTPLDRPSFKNTLSSGDRTTLALAFFLAHLKQNIAKTVVFDDPFGSQDAFRRCQTVHEIAKVGQSCAQVIVLSHDTTFLKQVWEKAPAAERVTLTLADQRAQGTKIMSIDIERACRGRMTADINDLLEYLNSGAGAFHDVIRKMRIVLETYCWTTYPAYFQSGHDSLGKILQKIRSSETRHPAHALYDELNQINEYTSKYHHGEDMTNVTSDQIDPSELAGYAKRTLRVVNALQA